MIRSPSLQNLMTLPSGTVVRADYLFFSHVGMLSDESIGGERSVISFSARAGGLVEEPFSDFAAGRPVSVAGYPGRLAPEVVMQRARKKRGQKYDLLGFNCEHFIYDAHGLPMESPQLQLWVFAGGVAAAFALLARAQKR